MVKGDLVIRSYIQPHRYPDYKGVEVGIITGFDIVEHDVHNFEAVCPTKYTKYAIVLWPDNYDTHERPNELTLASEYYEMQGYA